MKAHVPVNHAWCAIDMDGTLCEDNHYPKLGPPRPGAKEAMEKLHQMGYKVMVFTARTAIMGLDGQYQDVNQHVQAIYNWAERHQIKIDYVFPMPKPTHIVFFVDDRAIPIVSPPDSSRDHKHFWEDVIAAVERRFGPTAEGWQRDVTPNTFDVVQDIPESQKPYHGMFPPSVGRQVPHGT